LAKRLSSSEGKAFTQDLTPQNWGVEGE
jgi:hypothetical protein